MNEPLRAFLAREQLASLRVFREDTAMGRAFLRWSLLTAAAALGEPVRPEDTYASLRQRLLLSQEPEDALPDSPQNPPATTTHQRNSNA